MSSENIEGIPLVADPTVPSGELRVTSPAERLPVPTPGRVVLYVLGDEGGSRKGEVRPAIVVAVRHPTMPNLQVIGDGPNDDPGAHGPGGFGGTSLWRGSVPHGGPEQPGTWYWPPRA